MSNDKSLELSLSLQLLMEKLRRTINECQDIDLLRDIAFELLDLNKKRISIDQLKTQLYSNIHEGGHSNFQDN